MKAAPTFQKRIIGASPDRRTNRWELTCPCGKRWIPTTTMFAKRHEQCPKCRREELVDYNAD